MCCSAPISAVVDFEVAPRARAGLSYSMERASRMVCPDEPNAFGSVPDDVLALVVRHLGVEELLAFGICAQRFRGAVEKDEIWEDLFNKRFGVPSKLHRAAHKIAASWLKFYKAKILTDKASDPWRKPTEYELKAALQEMTQSGTAIARSSSADSSIANNSNSPTASPASSSSSMDLDDEDATAAAEEADELCVVFLVDGSGSVGEEDFTCMTSFLETAGEAVAAVPRSKVSIVQFSNDTRVEVALAPWDKETFESGIRNMVRMNGGTNIAAAVAKAGSLFKALPSCGPLTRRVLVLLTDGRIDSYQAREAGHMVAKLADEQANVGLWAFGVGRGVDAPELMRIIEGPGESAKGLGKERYVELCVRDDAPW